MVLPQLLKAMRGPSKHTANCERRSEQLNGQSKSMKQESSVKFYVRLKPPSGLMLFQQTQRRALDILCEEV